MGKNILMSPHGEILGSILQNGCVINFTMSSSKIIHRAALLAVSLLSFSPFALKAAHTEAELLLASDAAQPGETILAGVQLTMESGWHTYWKNPGESGQATEIKWQLPAGVTAGEAQWPAPKKLPPADVTTYGYEESVMLIVPLKLGKNLAPGNLDIAAKVSWLECKDSCIPASKTIHSILTIGAESKVASASAQITNWQSKVPKLGEMTANASWEKTAIGDTRPLVLQFAGLTAGADFFPYAYDNFELQGLTEPVSSGATTIALRKLVKKFSGGWPDEISGVLVNGGVAREVKLTVDEKPFVAATKSAAQPAPPLWRMLIYAFIGGLILNIMPCVLPVIALKILGFVSEAKSSPRRVRVLGLIYALGVLVSFLTLATIVLGVKAAGHKAGWGMQFGNPVFLVCLTTLVTLVALNLFGIFEVTLGGRAMDTASDLSAKNGAPGAFFNGVLATALATPCTAPFLSIALGFAFAQGAVVVLLIFSAVAAGLASPYVLLTWNPAWLKFLPKPGAWMEKFKMAMAFPMFLTAVWLFNLAAGNYGERAVWLGIFLVLIAMAAWIYGEFVQRARSGRLLGLVTFVAVILASYVMVLEKQLHWRKPVLPANMAINNHDPESIAWEPWTPEAVAKARATGRPVLVDFTADWCLTCQVNKRSSIETAEVFKKIHELNAIALLADYTHFPDRITTELNHFNRAGVPLVLVYPKNPDTEPAVLPEVLTPGIVLNALDRAVT